MSPLPDEEEDEGEEQPARPLLAPPPKVLAIEPALEKTRNGKRWCWYVERVELMFTTWAPICLTCGKHVRWLGPPERRAAEKKSDPDLYIYRISCGCKGDDGWSQQDDIETDWPLRIYAPKT